VRNQFKQTHRAVVTLLAYQVYIRTASADTLYKCFVMRLNDMYKITGENK
jgi:hypothetical protein